MAFVILTDAPIVKLDLGPVAPISEAIDVWRGAIASDVKSKDGAEAATKLRKCLWEPLEGHLAGRRVVLVSPYGALGRLPWGALPGSRTGSYLIEERSIALLPVPQMLPELLAFRKPLGTAQRLLLVGDVDFDAEPPGAALATAQGTKDDPSKETEILQGELREAPRGGALLKFERLASTQDEIEMVGDTFESAYVGAKLSRLTGMEATEGTVRKAAPEHEFIHLASRGFFAPEELKSALAPSKAEGIGGAQLGLGPAMDVIGWHPGLLSGIVLAGALARVPFQVRPPALPKPGGSPPTFRGQDTPTFAAPLG